MRFLLVAVMLLVSGCMTPDDAAVRNEENGSPGPTTTSAAPVQDEERAAESAAAWDQLQATGCTFVRMAIVSHQAIFPFAPPEDWPGPRMLQVPSFFLHAYSCQTILLGTEHVFYNASFAWESHTNMSWKENPNFDSDYLQALLGFYVQNETLAALLETAGLDITHAEITMSGGLQSPVVNIVGDNTSIAVSMEGAEYVPNSRARIVHAVPPQSTGEWLRLDTTETRYYNYGPAQLHATGDSATATMARSLEAEVPTLEGYAAEGSLQMTWEAGFA